MSCAGRLPRRAAADLILTDLAERRFDVAGLERDEYVRIPVRLSGG